MILRWLYRRKNRASVSHLYDAHFARVIARRWRGDLPPGYFLIPGH